MSESLARRLLFHTWLDSNGEKRSSVFHQRLVGLWEAAVADPANLRWTAYWLWHRRRSPVAMRQPWITFLALEWLSARIRPGFSVLEYGSGGSTLYLGSRCASVVTVEHDEQWAASMRPALGACGQRVDLRVVPPRCGETNPCTPSARFPDPRADFSEYVAVAHEFPDGSFDVVSIDGRARMACIAASRSKLKPGGLLVLDNSERSDYAAAAGLLAGWTRHDFVGIGLVSTGPWRTTIWQAPPSPSA